MIQRMFVTIDTKKTNYKNVGKINHGDDLILELTVLSDGDMISFNDPMVDLLVKKSDGKMIRQNSGIEYIQPNKFIIEVKKDCVTSPGLATNQLIINDNGRISTCMFYYTILNSLEEDIIESISNVEVLEQLDEFTIQIKDKMENFDEELQNRMSELEDAIDDLVEFFGDTSVDLLEAELSRNEAEQSRAQAESVRVQNENRRLQNDLDLANAEAERVRAENIRIQNEVDRALVDAVMDQKESEREDSELERIQNESKRATDELVRQQNESVRQSNESVRISNENDRKTQENRRATAETNRVNAETTRRNNENSRISNEIERQKAMNEMNSLLEDAREFDERVGVIEDEIDEINSSLDNMESNLNDRGINALYPPLGLEPISATGEKDDSEKLQKLIDYCQGKGYTLILPPKKILLENTVRLGLGVHIKGTKGTTWSGEKGTVIISNFATVKEVFNIAGNCVTIEDIKIKGNDNVIGIKTNDNTYDLEFNNIKMNTVKIGFDIGYSWTYVFNKCRVESADIGFNILNGTSGNFISCVAFHCTEHGFYVEGTQYCTFSGCGSDGCERAIEIVGPSRGLTFSSWGMENCKSKGIISTNFDACATFTGLNIGNHKDEPVDLIVCDGGQLTFTDLRYASSMAVAPTNKFLTVNSGGYVTLINCYLTGETLGDIDKCTVLGGILDNNLNRKLTVPQVTTNKISSLEGKSQSLATDTSEYIFTAEKNSSYICSAVVQGNGLQYCYQIVSTCNTVGSNSKIIDIGTKASCEFSIDSENKVYITNKAASNKVYNWSVLKIR